MPDISELNGNAVADLSEVDGLAKANIADIDGLTLPSADGTPTAAYSVRLLGSAVGISSYTGACMRVRRSSDNVEADVGFDTSNELSLTSPISNTSDAQSYTDLADFVDHTGTPTHAFVRIWYDQSRSNDAGQATASQQPLIYDSTTGLITENGKSALQTDGSTSSMLLETSSYAGDSGPVSVFAVRNCTLTSNTEGVIIDQTDVLTFSSSDGFRFDCYNNTYRFGTNRSFSQSSFTTPTGQELQSGVANISGRTLYIDGSSVATTSGDQTTTGTTAPLTLLATRHSSPLAFEGTTQEIILYTGPSDGDQSSNRTGIETNINTHYGVYPTSGLLVDYPGSYRAYSLRKLQNLAVYAIRVQRHSAPFDEQDIGFTASGDLDTQAIVNFAGTDVVGVKTWYNQAHYNAAQHLTQSNTSYQPLIFDGTSVYQSNGKPAIYYDATDKQLADTSSSGTGVNSDIFNVHQRNSGTGYFLHWYSGSFQVARMTTQYRLGWSGGTTGPSVDTDQHLFTGIATGTTGQIRLDGTASTAGTLDGSRKFGGEFAIQGRPGFPGANPGPGDIYHQEFIQYDFNNTGADVTAIENDIKTHYGIP